MTKHGMRLFPVRMVLSAAVITGALATGVMMHGQSTPAANGTDAASAPAAVAAAPVPEAPKNPADMPPRPPKVSCRGDQITISADNSTLDAILVAVKGCTGARIDMPADAGRIRSFEELGPGPVRQILDQLLSGTPYNYVIQSSEANPLKVEQVMLSMRTDDGGKPGASTAISTDIPMTAGRRAWQKMQKFDKPDPSMLNADGTMVEMDAASPAEEANGNASAPPAEASNAPAASSSDAPPVEAAAAPAPAATLTPVAKPIVDPSSGADSSKAIQDRIAAMQQMFAQRQQMMQKQNQQQSGAPNN
jgi:hypothetical protein